MAALNDILLGNDEPIYAASSPLSRLWRLHLYASGVLSTVWQARLIKHLQAVTKIDKDVNISDYKGNLLKALDKDDLPWQRFCQGMGVFSPNGFEFTIKLVISKEEFIKTIIIDHTYKENRGEILSELWIDIKDKYPTRFKDWKNLVAEYSKKDSAERAKKNGSRDSNLKSGLSKSSITWKSFHTGILVLDPDFFSIGVKSYDVETETTIVKKK